MPRTITGLAVKRIPCCVLHLLVLRDHVIDVSQSQTTYMDVCCLSCADDRKKTWARGPSNATLTDKTSLITHSDKMSFWNQAPK